MNDTISIDYCHFDKNGVSNFLVYCKDITDNWRLIINGYITNGGSITLENTFIQKVDLSEFKMMTKIMKKSIKFLYKELGLK